MLWNCLVVCLNLMRDIEVYKGYKEVTLNEYELSLHYQCPVNKWNLLDNEYLIIKNADKCS